MSMMSGRENFGESELGWIEKGVKWDTEAEHYIVFAKGELSNRISCRSRFQNINHVFQHYTRLVSAFYTKCMLAVYGDMATRYTAIVYCHKFSILLFPHLET
jgi:hypothetical protein